MNDRPPSFSVPDQRDEPVVWDPKARDFVPASGRGRAVSPARGKTVGRSTGSNQWFVGADAVGKAPPPREPAAGRGPAPVERTTVAPRPAPGAAASVAAPSKAAAASAAARAARPPARPVTGNGKGPAAKSASGAAPATARRRRRFLRRPKLRTVLLFVTLVPLLLLLAGWWYANAQFGKIERVPVAEVLDPIGGGGTNFLIVGSDSRDVVAEAGSTDPHVQPAGDATAGERSDTMLVLRVQPDGAKIMSIPRDLFVTIADTGEEGRINGAYRGGPQNLIRTVQQNLGIPIHRYVEVDFVTFSSLVDALGGVTLGADVVPCPAVDDSSGLVLPSAGPVEVDGTTALAFVRSRHYEDCNGTDPTGDLGRVARQQGFLRAVLAEAGASRNPLTLMRVASSVTDGLRIDDRMSMIDAIRFAWNMGKLNPESVVLPTTGFRTSAGAAVLELVDAPAQVELDKFR